MMYQDAIGIFRRYWAFILVASALSFFCRWIVTPLGTSGQTVVFIISAFVGYYFYLMLLSDEPVVLLGKNKTIPKLTYWIACSLPFVISLTIKNAVFFGMLSFDVQLRLTAISSVVAFFISYYILFALIGTMIPAAAANNRTGIKAALGRSPQTFRYILGHLLIGPFLVSLFLGAVSFGSTVIALTPSYMSPFADVSIGGALCGVLITAGSFFPSALVASILSRAYLRVEDVPTETSAPTT